MNQKGQQIIEYILLVAAVVVGMMLFLGIRKSPFHRALEHTIGNSVEILDEDTRDWNPFN